MSAITITVQTMKSVKHECKATSSDTVDQLREKISTQCPLEQPIPAAEMRVIFNGQILKNMDATLEAEGIGDAALVVIMKIRKKKKRKHRINKRKRSKKRKKNNKKKKNKSGKKRKKRKRRGKRQKRKRRKNKRKKRKKNKKTRRTRKGR